MRTELRKVSFGSDDDDGAVRTVALSWITQEPTTALRMTLQIAEYGRVRVDARPRPGVGLAGVDDESAVVVMLFSQGSEVHRSQELQLSVLSHAHQSGRRRVGGEVPA